MVSGAPDGHAFVGAQPRWLHHGLPRGESGKRESRPALPSAAACTRDMCKCWSAHARPSKHRRPPRLTGRKGDVVREIPAQILGSKDREARRRGESTVDAWRVSSQKRALAANRTSRMVHAWLKWTLQQQPQASAARIRNFSKMRRARTLPLPSPKDRCSDANLIHYR